MINSSKRPNQSTDSSKTRAVELEDEYVLWIPVLNYSFWTVLIYPPAKVSRFWVNMSSALFLPKVVPSPCRSIFYTSLRQQSKHTLTTVFSMDLFLHAYLFLNQGFLDDENRFAFIFKVFQMF